MRSFRQLLLFVVLLSLSTVAFAQDDYTVSGVVTNEKGEPVKSATVFIGGSQRVTPTDEGGRFIFSKLPQGTFKLSVQMLGYAPLIQNVNVKDASVKVDLKLSPKAITLAEVKVGNNKAWEENFNIFKTQFLGNTANGKQCIIVNPGALNFSTKKGVLYADADEFLVIENKRLGYRIKYMLKYFSYDKAQRLELHDGEFTFEELEGTFQMQDLWAKTRLQTYQGSFRHFLRSVYANNVAENGFLARPLYGYRRVNVESQMATANAFSLMSIDPSRVTIKDSPIKFDSLISAIDTTFTSFKFRQMLVTYDPKKAIKFAAKKPATDNSSMSLSSSESILVLSNEQAVIDSRGSYVDYKSFFITGKWGTLRVGDQLPFEYKPPMPEIPRRDVPTNQLLASLHKWTDSLPQEKVYLHMDKPYYAQGDTIWFKGYLTNGADHQLTQQSGAAYVELVDDKAQLIKRLKLQVNQGTIAGDLVLVDSVKAGNYRVRAYTQWMRNAGEEYFFDKTITVGDPLDDKNKPVPENVVAATNPQQTDIQFFPESGSLITGVPSRIAFKATGTDGLGVPVGGYVTDNDNKQVAQIFTRHAGMGNFVLTPGRGRTYTATIKFADSTTKSLPLPVASREGYVLSVYQTSRDSVLVRIHASDLLQPSNINLIAHSSGRVIFSSPITIKGPVTNVWLNKTLFPSGVAQFTIFNTKNQPLIERIAFIKNPDQMQLVVNADSSIYNRRGRVQLKLNAKDSEGAAIGANFSVAVIDENKVPVDETAESTIFSHLLLTSDIKGYVERPNYYFTTDTSEMNRALDNLMLTQGYRRFEWKNLESTLNTAPVFAAEAKGSTISGKVTNLQGKLLEGASVSLLSLNARINKSTSTDADGRFKFENLVFADSARFAVASKIPESTNGTIITIDTIPNIEISQKQNLAEVQLIENKLQQVANEGKPAKLTGLHDLKEVKIKAIKVVDNENRYAMQQGPLTQRDASVDKVIRIQNPEQFQDIGTFLLAGIPGVTMETGPTGVTQLVDMRRMPSLNVTTSKDDASRDIAVLVNGMSNYDIDDIMNGRVFLPVDVDRIQVIRTSLPAKERMRGAPAAPRNPGERPNTGSAGFVNIILKHPSQRKQYNPHIANIMPKGFNLTREFYSPKYDRPQVNARIPDLRTTIYWNPYVNTDTNGEVKFDFYNGDGAGTYRVVVEGINAEGELGRQVFRYKVE
ncbi:MAG: carboxypeptidase regulatory-like domain-containing protein [Bacteroidota bacterium]